MNITNLLAWLGSRFTERSSWLGIIAVLTTLGITISPELQDVITQIGVGLGGLIALFTADKPAASTTTTTTPVSQ